MTARPDAVLAVAAHGLGAGPAPSLREPLDDLEWPDLLARVRSERLTGLLVAAIGDGSLPATTDQGHRARSAHVEHMAFCLRLERLLIEVIAVLDSGGIDHRVLKGPAVAHLDYADASLRSFMDVDLLVPAERYDDADRLLVGIGLTRRFPEPRPGFDRQFGKGMSYSTEAGLAVDLHRTLVFGPFGLTVDLADLWARPDRLDVANHSLRAMNPEARLLHACLHAIIGDVPPRLLSLRDVVTLSVGRDPEVLVDMARRWRIGSVVERSFATVRSTLGVEIGAEAARWAPVVGSTRFERRLLGVCVDPTASYATKTLASVLVIPGLAPKATFLRALALPDRGYLTGRHGTHRQRWGRAWQQVVAAGMGRARRARTPATTTRSDESARPLRTPRARP